MYRETILLQFIYFACLQIFSFMYDIKMFIFTVEPKIIVFGRASICKTPDIESGLKSYGVQLQHITL